MLEIGDHHPEDDAAYPFRLDLSLSLGVVLLISLAQSTGSLSPTPILLSSKPRGCLGLRFWALCVLYIVVNAMLVLLVLKPALEIVQGGLLKIKPHASCHTQGYRRDQLRYIS